MAFDNDPAIIGQTFAGIQVTDVSEMQNHICPRGIPIAILTVPAGKRAGNGGSVDTLWGEGDPQLHASNAKGA